MHNSTARSTTRKRSRIALSIQTLIISMVAASCLASPEGSDLEVARERWAAAGITDYEFQFQRSCFCPPEYTAPVIIEVRNGAIQTIRYADTGEPVAADRFSDYETVEGMFDIIDDAIARDAAELIVTYDPEYGYPLSVQIDYDRNVADEEQYLSAGDLRPL